MDKIYGVLFIAFMVCGLSEIVVDLIFDKNIKRIFNKRYKGKTAFYENKVAERISCELGLIKTLLFIILWIMCFIYLTIKLWIFLGLFIKKIF